MKTDDRLNDRNAKCPFLRGHTPKTITCEGMLVGAQCSVQLVFVKKSDKQAQFKNYCCERYAYCEMYRSIEREKYDED